VVQVVNKVNTMPSMRSVMDATLGIARGAALPTYAGETFRDSARASIAWPVRDGARTPGQGGHLLDVLRQLQRAVSA